MPWLLWLCRKCAKINLPQTCHICSKVINKSGLFSHFLYLLLQPVPPVRFHGSSVMQLCVLWRCLSFPVLYTRMNWSMIIWLLVTSVIFCTLSSFFVLWLLKSSSRFRRAMVSLLWRYCQNWNSSQVFLHGCWLTDTSEEFCLAIRSVVCNVKLPTDKQTNGR